MVKEIKLDMELCYILDAYQIYSDFLPEIQTLRIEAIDESNYSISGWERYFRFIESLGHWIPSLQDEVSRLDKMVSLFGYTSEPFTVPSAVALIVKEKADFFVAKVREYATICELIVAGKYELYPKVTRGTGFEAGVIYCCKINYALIENPYFKDATIIFDGALRNNYVEPTHYICLLKEDRVPFEYLKYKAKLCAVASKYYERWGNIRRERSLLKEYLVKHNLPEVDFCTLDTIEKVIIDEVVADLGRALYPLRDSLDKERIRTSMKAFLSLMSDFNMILCLKVDIEE